MLPLAFRSFLFSRSLKRVCTTYKRASLSLSTMARTPWVPNTYPSARRSDHVDIYKSAARGEVRVPDPYQWLEEYTDETDKWTSAQEAFTRSYLDKNPDLPRLENVFRDCNDYPKVLSAAHRSTE